jgi:hypothetical protein
MAEITELIALFFPDVVGFSEPFAWERANCVDLSSLGPLAREITFVQRNTALKYNNIGDELDRCMLYARFENGEYGHQAIGPRLLTH